LAIAHFHSGNNRQAISQLDELITRLESSSSVATQGGAERRILDEAYRYRALSHARAGDSAAANAALNELRQRKIDASVKACTEAMVLSYLESAFDASQLESLAESPTADAKSLLNIASAYSMASEIIRDENVTLSKLYADRAVSLIRDALKAGLSDIERLETDPFLDPLQKLPEFNELLESDGRGVRYAAVWNNSGWAESVSLSGLDPESHREECRQLMRDGYRVGSIGATQIGNDIVTASVWLRPLISSSERERLARRQANATAAAIRMGEAEQAWPLLTTSPDPRLQSWIIHRLATTGVSPDVILERLRQEADPSVAQALILSLGNFDVASLDNRSAMTSMLLGRYRADPDAGIRSAAQWTLKRWGFKDELESIDRELAGRTPSEDSDWYVSKSGQTMVVIRGPVESLMGSPYTEPDRSSFEHLHKKRISRSFAISSKEITVDQFAEFLRDYPRLSYAFSRKQAGEADCPQISVTWYEAAMYCRWLSEREEIAEDQMCYPEIEEIKPGMSLPDDYLSRHGYRLPTEAEWEYACRANTITSRYYGNTDDLLGQYAWYLQNSDYRTWPVASLKPNRFGLFDMLGNVQEWCQESVSNYSDSLGQVSEDQPVSDVINDADRRLLRGGGFGIPSADIRSAYRGRNRPSARYNNTGFRVVRTHPAR
jgi:formylglycine-generating enzyme required for sulfatase activity